MENQPISVLHYFTMAKWLTVFLPLCIIVGCYSVTYSIHKNAFISFPFLQEFSSIFPESRIFAISTLLLSIDTAFILFIRVHVFKILSLKKERLNKERYSKAYKVMNLSSGLAVIGNLLMAFFPSSWNKYPFIVGINLLSLGFSVYFFANDIASKAIGYGASLLSKFMSLAYLTGTLIFLTLRYYIPGVMDSSRFLVSNICGLISYIMLYTKFILIQFDIPTYAIRVSRKLEFDE